MESLLSHRKCVCSEVTLFLVEKVPCLILLFDELFPFGFLSDDESEDRTPLSKRATDVQSILAEEKNIINVANSPKKKKKRIIEGSAPSSSKKQKISRKSETALKTIDSDDIDDTVDKIDLQASDDVRFPRTKDVRL